MSKGHEKLIRELVMVQKTGYRHVGLLPSANKEFEKLEKRWKKDWNGTSNIMASRTQRCLLSILIPKDAIRLAAQDPVMFWYAPSKLFSTEYTASLPLLKEWKPLLD